MNVPRWTIESHDDDSVTLHVDGGLTVHVEATAGYRAAVDAAYLMAKVLDMRAELPDIHRRVDSVREALRDLDQIVNAAASKASRAVEAMP